MVEYGQMTKEGTMRGLALTAFAAACALCAIEAHAAICVSPSGDDSSGDGSSARPYASLGRALLDAREGDTISMSAGSYTMAYGLYVPANVSIVGAGKKATVIDCSAVASSLLELESESPTDSTNQTIRGIGFVGGNSCPTAVSVRNRNGVTIAGCAMENFAMRAIFASGHSHDRPMAGLTISRYDLTNCSGMLDGHYIGAFTGTLLKDLEIAHCSFRETKASQGWPIKLWWGEGIESEDVGCIYGARIHHNYILKSLFTTYSITIEGKCLYGVEIDHNTICGSIDPNSACSYDNRYVMEADKYSFGCWIHDNVIGFADHGRQDAFDTPGWTNPGSMYGTIIEMGARDVIVERNIFRNCGVASMFLRRTGGYEQVHNIVFRYNLGYNLQSPSGCPFFLQCSDTDPSGIDVEGISIHNNIFSASAENQPGAVINMNRDGWISSLSNVYIYNNILLNAYSQGVFFEKNIARGSNINVYNNIMYNTGGTVGIGPTARISLDVNSANVTTDPHLGDPPNLYITDASTNAIGTGASVPAGCRDLRGTSVPRGPLPNIGCYEKLYGQPFDTGFYVIMM